MDILEDIKTKLLLKWIVDIAGIHPPTINELKCRAYIDLSIIDLTDIQKENILIVLPKYTCQVMFKGTWEEYIK